MGGGLNREADRQGDPDYVRALGDAEQGIDLLETARARCHIVRVIIFEGALDTALFERALRHLLERRPLVNTRIVRPPGEAPYFARGAEPPEFSVVERVDAEQWRAEFEHQMSTPVSVAGDHMMRVRVLAGTSAGEIVLSCHHAVCDGRSLTRFCGDLLQEYEWLKRRAPGDPAAVAGAVSPSIEEILPAALTGPRRQEILDAYVADRGALVMSAQGSVIEAEPRTALPSAIHLLTYELPPSAVKVLASSARANGTTVGGAISAAIVRAGLDIGGAEADDGLGLISSIDLRPLLGENVPLSNMGMYATSWPNYHPDVRTKSFWAPREK